MGLTAQDVAAYERDGFLVLPDVLTAAECRAAADEIESVLADVRQEAVAAGQPAEEAVGHGVFVGLSLRRESFRRLARDPRLVDPLESLWGPEIGFLSDKVVFKDSDVEFGSPWHQDWSYWQGSHKISIWLALDDATPENGCLMLIPGSHREAIEHDHIQDATTRGGFGNRLDITQLGLADEPVTVPVAAGSAVLFHDLTLHASLPNASGAPRRALIITYRDLSQPDLEYPGLPAAAPIRGSLVAATP